MNLKENWGSLTSLVLGFLSFAAGVNDATNHTGSGGGLVAGPVMIVGALIYRSAKKRRGLETNSPLRIAAEIFGVLIILGLAFGQNNLKQQIATDPVPNVIIPVWALIAYAYMVARSSSKKGGHASA